MRSLFLNSVQIAFYFAQIVVKNYIRSFDAFLFDYKLVTLAATVIRITSG